MRIVDNPPRLLYGQPQYRSSTLGHGAGAATAHASCRVPWIEQGALASTESDPLQARATGDVARGRKAITVKRLLAIFLVLAGLGLASAQSASQTLVVGLSKLPRTLDSGDANDSSSIAVTRQIVQNLVWFKPGTATLEPGLATSWSGNSDSTEWTFHLRTGVTFQDGTPFNAQAVKFDLDRWNDASNPYHFGSEGKAYVGWRNLFGGFLGQGSALKDVKVIDDSTVQLDLTRSVAFLPAMMAAGYFGFDSPTAVKKDGVNYGTPSVGSVGTGPFEFVQWVEGSKVVLKANQHYWGPQPKVEQLVFEGIPDATARLAQLKAGALDIAMNLSPSDLKNMENDPNLNVVYSKAGMNVSYLAMHQANSPFDKQKVREAVAYAIDKQGMLKAFYAGLGATAKDVLPPALWGHADVQAYPYNPEKAKQLLAEAGYPNGFKTQLWYRNTASNLFPDPQGIAETIATYLADVGIQADIKTEDWSSYLKDYLAGRFPMYLLGWNADFADPDNFIYTFFGPMAVKRYGWNDPQVVAMATKARELPTQEDRAKLYAQILTVVHQQVPMIPLIHATNIDAVRKGVTGFVPNPLGAVPHMDTVSKAP